MLRGSHAAFARWILEVVWSKGRTETLGEVIGPLTFHYGGAQRQTDGHDLRTVVERWRAGFPDLRFDVHDVVEQGDRVAVRARMRGTHLGPWRDLAATGRSMDIDVAMFFRWEGDRLVEVWEVDDVARRDRQLGLG